MSLWPETQGIDSIAETASHHTMKQKPEESPKIIVATAEIAPPWHVLVQLQFLLPCVTACITVRYLELRRKIQQLRFTIYTNIAGCQHE
jgi:hypothetical protein